jgi:hypothetical protein
MRVLACLSIAVTLSGCATQRARVQSQPDRPVVNDWATVLALRVDTYLAVTLDANGHRFGFLEEVTDTTLTIRTISDHPGTVTIPRADIVRVEADLPIRRRHRWLRIPMAAGILGGLAGMVAGAIQHDKGTSDWSAAAFKTGLIAGLVYYADHPPWQALESRLVYVRP